MFVVIFLVVKVFKMLFCDYCVLIFGLGIVGIGIVD